MVQYGFFPLSSFERISFEVLEPIEPAGISPDELVQRAEAAIKQKLGQ